MHPILSDIAVNTGGGSGMVHSLFAVLIVALSVGIVWGLGRWFIVKLAAPAMAMTVWNGLFLLIGAIVIINFLMSLGGHAFITW